MESYILIGDCREALRTLLGESVHCVVTSPPYFGLRDYGHGAQIGLEPTPDEYIQNLVEVFREVRRVLRNDGTLWLNLGDSYVASPRGNKPGDVSTSSLTNPQRQDNLPRPRVVIETEGSSDNGVGRAARADRRLRSKDIGKPKDLLMIPAQVALALRADGWYLRQDIIWHKTNPMPESVRDRCTKSHEYIFLLSKSPRYYFDNSAIAEPSVYAHEAKYDNGQNGHGGGVSHAGQGSSTRKFRSANRPGERGVPVDTGGKTNGAVAGSIPWEGVTRNKRDVWTVTTKPFKGAHFATFPPDLIEPCILVGCPEGGVVLDPFFGAGTTGLVAQRLHRYWIGCELNEEYAQMAYNRISADVAAGV